MFEIPVNIGKVVSISVHGRKVFYLTMTDGTKQEFGDVNDLLKVLVGEIGDYRKARKFINQLENKVWMHGLKEHEKELGHRGSDRKTDRRTGAWVGGADYGAWVLPDGEVVQVGPGLHKEAVRDRLGWGTGYKHAFREGWVRVVFGKELDIEKGSDELTVQQKRVLRGYLDNPSVRKVITQVMNGSEPKYFDLEELDKAEKWVMAASARELVKIARELVSGMLDEPQYDTGFFEQSPFPPTNEYRNPPTETDPASEVTHCQCSVNPV